MIPCSLAQLRRRNPPRFWRWPVAGLFLAGCLTAAAENDWLKSWRAKNPCWRGIQLSVSNDGAAERLAQQLPRLAAIGVNALVVEVDYHFAFDSHPELRQATALSKTGAAKLARACRAEGLRPIPLFNCLGHQSWAKQTFPLLVKYPELDETPGQFPENKDIYCRSWCPQHPEVNRIVFALLDELIDAFQADALHVGMDEVFLIASEHCARCRGGDPAKLFARAVNDLHAHVVGKRKLEMLLWADRLLDAKATGYGPWEAATNGTHPAIDLAPKDLILCDWHYGQHATYPSIGFFLDKGFRVWPSGWNKVPETEALIAAAKKHRQPRMLGHLCTTWGAAPINELAAWPPIVAAMREWTEAPAGPPRP
jgi:hypothetical protein